MSLQGYTVLTANQTIADAAVDQLLMDTIREDLQHLREMGYGMESSSGFYSIVRGHDHDGVNSRGFTSFIDDTIGSGPLKVAHTGNFVTVSAGTRATLTALIYTTIMGQNLINYGSGDNGGLEVNSNGNWSTANGAFQGIAGLGTVFSDGANVRGYNTFGTSKTLQYDTLD